MVGTAEETGRERVMTEKEILSKVKELKDILKQSHENSYGMPKLPSEEQAIAFQLKAKAESLVEEITGEKWEFSYRTFGF